MKTAYKILFGLLAAAWMVGAFITWDLSWFSPGRWDEGARGAVVCVLLVLAMFVGGITAGED